MRTLMLCVFVLFPVILDDFRVRKTVDSVGNFSRDSIYFNFGEIITSTMR